MGALESALGQIGNLNELGRLDSWVHRLDPRAKLLTTLAFVVAVTSCGKYTITGLIPFVLYPVAMIAAGGLPTGLLLRKLLPAVPFALFIGIFNPLLDREPLLQIGSVTIAGGWVSFASIMLRVVLTVSAALILIATTGFDAVCVAMDRLGVPRVLVVQLHFLYRYLVVLVEEALRMVRAHGLRSLGRGSSVGVRVYGSMVGQWLLRTLDRGQRVHLAMLCRGFDGEIRMDRPLRLAVRDGCFVAGWCAFFLLARLRDIPQWIGALAVGVGQ